MHRMHELYPNREWNIAVTEQAAGEILVLDAACDDWNEERAVLWSWRPAHAMGAYDSLSGWGNPTDARIRKSEAHGGYCMVACASLGYAGLVRYPDANEVIWQNNIHGNLHAIDLLPDGNVAVAASTEDWVRVYAVSHGPHSEVYAEYPLTSAHGVHWDAEYNWLWVLGRDRLTALRLKGTPMAPELEEVLERRCMLPSQGGHDLYPVFGDPDRMLVTTHEDAYLYVKSKHQLIGLAEQRNEARLPYRKSLVSFAGDEVMEVVPDFHKDPQGPCSARNDWTTDTVDFYPSGRSRTRKGTAIYKARVWHCDDQGIR